MNNKYPSHLLPKGVFSSIKNAYIDNNKIFKRGGISIFGATMGDFLINGNAAFEPSGGSKYVIVSLNGVSNAQLQVSTGGAFSAIGSANLTNSTRVNFVQAANRLFGFNGVEVVDVASDGSTVTKNRAGVPIGTFGFWFHNYLFVGGVAANPNRLYWSNLGDPTTFSGSDYVDINANDGDSLTGLGALNDQLIVFKNASIWSIDGWSGATFSTTTIAGQNTQSRADGVGTPSHQSIVSVGKELFFLSFLGNIPHIRMLSQTVFAKVVEAGVQSDELETTMLGLNKSQLAKATGIFDGKFIYWSLPNGISTTNNLIIVMAAQRKYPTPFGPMEPWVIFEGINAGEFFTSTISGRARVYCADSTTGNVYLFNDTSSYSDNGTPITMTVDTRDFMGDISRKTKYVYMYHKYETGSSGTLKVYSRIDQYEDYSLAETISLAGNSPGLGPTGTFTLGSSQLGGMNVAKNRVTFASMTGTLLGVRFLEATANPCELYDFNILGIKKGLRDD